jgi:hypothetical protein
MENSYRAWENEERERAWQSYLADQRNPFALREKANNGVIEKVYAKAAPLKIMLIQDE